MGFFDSIIAEEEASTKVATSVVTPVKTANKPEINDMFGNENDLIIIDDTPIVFNEQSVIDKAEELSKIENIVTFSDEIKKEEIKEEIYTEDQKSDIPELQDLGIVASVSDQISGGNGDDGSSSGSGDDSKKGNPNLILDEAIKKLQALLSSHSDLRKNKIDEIEDINKKIASLKEDAKKLTNESKIIFDEETKINKMIELFSSQKIS